MAYSLQCGYSLIDCSISLTFSVGLTITVMKNVWQQEHFQGTNEHFLTAGGVEEPCPFGGGFPFPPSPSQLWELLAFSEWQFQKKHSVFENCKEHILQEMPVFALLSHTLGIIMGTKKRNGKSKSLFSNKGSFLPVLLPLKVPRGIGNLLRYFLKVHWWLLSFFIFGHTRRLLVLQQSQVLVFQ